MLYSRTQMATVSVKGLKSRNNATLTSPDTTAEAPIVTDRTIDGNLHAVRRWNAKGGDDFSASRLLHLPLPG